MLKLSGNCPKKLDISLGTVKTINEIFDYYKKIKVYLKIEKIML
tara:strand:+ start:255 stop:386 length:132 start_codon:yes stop_codon:yes gene_type:complete